MTDINTPLGLMVWLINFIAERFGNHAVLKGGMELRLVDCPRSTNDIDYVFIPYSSKKDIAPDIIQALSGVDELEVEHSINSKCLRCVCTYMGMSVQIEVNVADACETQELTTATLARAHGQQGRVVRAMRFDVALSHRIAAWNERGLVRDLYDCAFIAHTLAVEPHMETLQTRLSRSQLRSGRRTRTVSMSLPELVVKLRTAVEELNEDAVDEQMRDYLPPDALPGLSARIKTGLGALIERLSGGS